MDASNIRLLFPQPHDFSTHAVEAGSLLTAHSPLQEPGARVTLLFSKMGLLLGFALLQAQGHGGALAPSHPTATNIREHAETQTCSWLCD